MGAFQVLLALFLCLVHACASLDKFTEKSTLLHYRERVRSMFEHAYNGYMQHAFPYDELMPLTCKGTDTWGSFSLSLIDSLDTLLIMGNTSEFLRATELVLQQVDVDANVNVSVFETNIRVIGGLLSAHMLYAQLDESLHPAGWPCSGPLLDLAARFAARLLPAFHTSTGLPYGTVNLRYGVHNYETPVTCTAGAGTFLLEFGALTELTGNPNFGRAARRASDALWKLRSPLGLVGNHINVQTGQWTATDAGIGAGVDSYFEYLLKASALFSLPELKRQFDSYVSAIGNHIQHDDWFFWVSMEKAQVSIPYFQSLEAFWPGILALAGRVDVAQRIMLTYGQVLRQYGFPSEFYNVPNQEAVPKRSGYPLRPEMAESLLYLYRATKDPVWVQMGAALIEAIEHSARTECGYATVLNVKDHTLEDRMESFFLSETTKYLYLLFDEDNFMNNDGSQAFVVETTNGPCAVGGGGYVFNTEAHPIDPGVLYCCSRRRQFDKRTLSKIGDNLDLVDLMGLGDTDECAGNVNLDEVLIELPPGASELLSEEKAKTDSEHDFHDDEQEEVDGDHDERDADVEIGYETAQGERGSVLVSPPVRDVNSKSVDNQKKDSSTFGVDASRQTINVATAATLRALKEVHRLEELQNLLDNMSELETSEQIFQMLENLVTTESQKTCRRTSRMHRWLKLVNTRTCSKFDETLRDNALIYGLNLVANEVKASQLRVIRCQFRKMRSQCQSRCQFPTNSQYNDTAPDLDLAHFTSDQSAFSVGSISACGSQSALELAKVAARAVEDSYSLLSCRKQPFLSRFTGLGQVIPARLARLDEYLDEIGR